MNPSNDFNAGDPAQGLRHFDRAELFNLDWIVLLALGLVRFPLQFLFADGEWVLIRFQRNGWTVEAMNDYTRCTLVDKLMITANGPVPAYVHRVGSVQWIDKY